MKKYGEFQYDFDTSMGIDNILSMEEFLDWHLKYKDENLEMLDGTQAIFKHYNFDFKIVANSGGRGDFYSHKIEFLMCEE